MEIVQLDNLISEINDEEMSKIFPRMERVREEARLAVKKRKGVIFIEGPLGCGKSTFAECLANELQIGKITENVEEPRVKRYLAMLYHSNVKVKKVGAVGINNEYLGMRMNQYHDAITSAQSVVTDRIVYADDIYMQGFVRTGLMTREEMDNIRIRREREMKILRPADIITRPLEIVVQLTGRPEIFYERKNKRRRGVEVEENGKGVPFGYIKSLTKRYEGLHKVLSESGFRGKIVQINQEIKPRVFFDPSSGKHLLPLLEYIKEYFNGHQ